MHKSKNQKNFSGPLPKFHLILTTRFCCSAFPAALLPFTQKRIPEENAEQWNKKK